MGKTLEKKANSKRVPRGMIRCVATTPEHTICREVFPKKDAHYIGGPNCPTCYDRWFYQQD